MIKLSEFPSRRILILDSIETKANFLLFNQQLLIIGLNYDQQHYGRELFLEYSNELFTNHQLAGKVVAIDDISLLLFGGQTIAEILSFISRLEKLCLQVIIISHWDSQDEELNQLNAMIGHEALVLKLQKMSSGLSEHVDGEFLVYDDKEYREYLYKVTEKGGQLLHK